jgi:hypothetical protein
VLKQYTINPQHSNDNKPKTIRPRGVRKQFMKNLLKGTILAAASAAFEKGVLPSSDFSEVVLEEPKADSHGDLSTNMAMQMAKTQRMAPRKIAEALIDHLDDRHEIIARTEIAGPGFINFFIRPSAWHPVLAAVHEQDDQYGRCNIGKGAASRSNSSAPIPPVPFTWATAVAGPWETARPTFSLSAATTCKKSIISMIPVDRYRPWACLST